MSDISQGLLDEVLGASEATSPRSALYSSPPEKLAFSTGARSSGAREPVSAASGSTLASDSARSALCNVPDHLHFASTAAALSLLDDSAPVDWLPTQLLLGRL